MASGSPTPSRTMALGAQGLSLPMPPLSSPRRLWLNEQLGLLTLVATGLKLKIFQLWQPASIRVMRGNHYGFTYTQPRDCPQDEPPGAKMEYN